MPVRLVNDVQAAAAHLAQGGLAAFPTETVYGLGADASNPQALARIYAAKGRPSHHPLIVHVAKTDALAGWAGPVSDDVNQAVQRLTAAFWPGPLTLVLPRAAHVPDWVTGGQSTVALRCPAHPVARRLLAAFAAIKAQTASQGAHPPAGLAAPSANLFGHVSPTAAAHVLDEFGPSAEDIWVLEGEAAQVGIESTIVDLSRLEQTGPVLLRPGHISATQIGTVLGCPVSLPAHDPSTPRVSGSLKAHYAPRTPLSVVSAEGLQQRLAQSAADHHAYKNTVKNTGKTAVWHFSQMTVPAPPDMDCFLAPAQALAYARALYAQLRAFDAAGCYRRILIEQPPATAEWAGVLDRLGRAAAAFD